MPSNISFYDERRDEMYAHEKGRTTEQHAFYPILTRFIEQYDLHDKKCLEIGSAIGRFQDAVEDYSATDVAKSVAENYHKPYRVAEGGRYPYSDGKFDAIWTYTVYEHIPELQEAMLEIPRLLKPGGVVLFAPAWQCRPWAGEGYAVRPYGDFGWKGKLIKLSIPIRNSVAWRSLFLFPKRLARHGSFVLGKRYEEIRYRKLNANWDSYWQSDSDACNDIDPHDAILWFESHGFQCLSHPLHKKALLVRTGALVFQKNA